MLSKIKNNTLCVYFPGTEFTIKGWALNFFTWQKPYKDMEIPWFVHAGFLHLWKEQKKEFAGLITEEIGGIELHGLSQGGALAILAHEWVWFNYPKLNLKTITYGSPRVISWFDYDRVKDRFAGVQRIINRGDIVPHLPPVVFGYRHVGNAEYKKDTKDFITAHSTYEIRW